MPISVEGFVDVSATLRCGVYLLAYHGKVVYVGKSKTMLTRIYTHRNLASNGIAKLIGVKKIRFDEVLVRPCAPDQVDALEQHFIKLFRPHYNVHHKPAEPQVLEINYRGNVIQLASKALAQPEVPIRRRG